MVPAGKADGSGFGVVSGNKVHTCDFDVERNLTPGEDFYTADLDTGRGLVRIGAMICYDREFPESARILMLKGAEIILVPNACPMEQNRLTQLRARAFENMLGIATANYAYGQPDCNGHSSAFDGMAYRLGETHERDTLVIEAGEAEGIYLATFPIKEIRRYRSREVHANAYRHPRKYGVLVCEKKQAPFLREDSRFSLSQAHGTEGPGAFWKFPESTRPVFYAPGEKGELFFIFFSSRRESSSSRFSSCTEAALPWSCAAVWM